MGQLLYEQIYHFIIDEIKSKNYKVGDRIPSENELASRFDVSRITSRKALEMLAEKGIIERIPGKGSFLTNNSLVVTDDCATSSDNESIPEISLNQKLIGVLIPSFSEAFGIKLIKSIEHHCSKAGFRTVFKLTRGEQKEEKKAIREMIELQVDGIIIYPVENALYNDEILRLVFEDFPLISVDKFFKGIPCPVVCTDNKGAAEEITNLVIDAGHENIAFVSGSTDKTSSVEDRMNGFLTAVRENGTKVSKATMMTNCSPRGQFEFEKLQLIEFINQNPKVTAFIASEYSIAGFLYRVLHDLGKRVPDDYVIVCFDSAADVLDRPFFTHVRQNEAMMGEVAVRLLSDKLAGEKTSTITFIPYEIIQGSMGGRV